MRKSADLYADILREVATLKETRRRSEIKQRRFVRKDDERGKTAREQDKHYLRWSASTTSMFGGLRGPEKGAGEDGVSGRELGDSTTDVS